MHLLSDFPRKDRIFGQLENALCIDRIFEGFLEDLKEHSQQAIAVNRLTIDSIYSPAMSNTLTDF